MIKPPFTILILKNSRYPLTIRITTGIILLAFGIISLGGALAGFAITYLILHNTGDFSAASYSNSEMNYIQVEPSHNDTRMEPDIYSLSVKHLKNDNTELKLRLKALPENEEVYIWLIVNPEADTAGEMVVYPRNPIFKGLPVDYRNGITYFPSEGGDISITLSDDTAGIDIEEFRILIFSPEGEIIADRYFKKNSEFRIQNSENILNSCFIIHNS
jgi:hypothetical protein